MAPLSAQPAAKPIGRRDRRKAEVRARIIDASLELFSSQDYVDTTVEQITEAADVGKGTFFNYFDCKEHVLSGLSVRQLAQIEDAVDQAIRDERPTEETLRKILHLTADTPGKSRTLMRNLLVGNFSSEQSSDYLREYVEKALGAVQELLRWARARGSRFDGKRRVAGSPVHTGVHGRHNDVGHSAAPLASRVAGRLYHTLLAEYRRGGRQANVIAYRIRVGGPESTTSRGNVCNANSPRRTDAPIDRSPWRCRCGNSHRVDALG